MLVLVCNVRVLNETEICTRPNCSLDLRRAEPEGYRQIGKIALSCRSFLVACELYAFASLGTDTARKHAARVRSGMGQGRGATHGKIALNCSCAK